MSACRVTSCYRQTEPGLEFCTTHGWNGNQPVEQLNIFQQPEPEPVVAAVSAPRVAQLTELPGETWEDIFDRKGAA